MPLPALAPILLMVILAAVFRIILAIGIGFVAFTVALPNIYAFISGYFNQLPPDILQMVGILRIDQCITLILSAGAARLAYKISAAPLVNFGS